MNLLPNYSTSAPEILMQHSRMVNLAFSSMALIEEKKGNLSVQELPMNM
jgi:hypothetical protein